MWVFNNFVIVVINIVVRDILGIWLSSNVYSNCCIINNDVWSSCIKGIINIGRVVWI